MSIHQSFRYDIVRRQLPGESGLFRIRIEPRASFEDPRGVRLFIYSIYIQVSQAVTSHLAEYCTRYSLCQYTAEGCCQKITHYERVEFSFRCPTFFGMCELHFCATQCIHSPFSSTRLATCMQHVSSRNALSGSQATVVKAESIRRHMCMYNYG